MADEIEDRKLAFEERKWEAETSLRKAELEIKYRENGWFSKLFSPLTTTLLAGTVTLAASATGVLLQGRSTLQLEKEKFDFSQRLETQKEQHDLVVKMISVGDQRQARENLQFLAESGLIADETLARKLQAAKATPLIPPTSTRYGFEPTDALTQTLQADLQKRLDDYIVYLHKVAFPDPQSKVTSRVDKLPDSPAYYLNNKIFIDIKIATDPHVAFREYNHHVLNRNKDQPWESQYGAIESALADYYACSYSNTPKFGQISARVLGIEKPYLRALDNDRKFTEFRSISNASEVPYEGAEIWGGAFWAIRSTLGRQLADEIFATAWLSVSWPTEETLKPAAFVEAILSASTRIPNAPVVNKIRTILQARDFPLQR